MTVRVRGGYWDSREVDMGTPVICPHCNSFFVAENEPGNPFSLCSHCGRWMNIAPVVNRHRKKNKTRGPAKCPFCQTQLAPGSDTCLQCKRQIITGEKLPLLRRLSLVSTGRKMVVLCSVLGGLIAVTIIVNAIVTYVRTTARPSLLPTTGVTDSADVITAREILAELAKADGEAEQVRIGTELGKVGSAAIPLILETMDASDLPDGARRGLVVALGQIGDPRGADVVAEAMRERNLRQVATVSLALMGDERAVGPIIEHFVEQVRQATLLNALAKRLLVPTEMDVAILRRKWGDRVARLHGPIAALGEQAIPGLLATYWRTWKWPTRDRGREWMDQVNRIGARMRFENGTLNDVLADLLTDQPPNVRLAAALLLSKRRAGGNRAAEKWAGQLADLLADSHPETRRRALWTITSVTGKPFGRFRADRPPADVPPPALTEAAEWIGNRTGRKVNIPKTLLAELDKRPVAIRMTYHPARAQARRLVSGLAKADWPTARARWSELAKLTPDAAPVVRGMLEGDVRQLGIPARLVSLQLLAQWRDRESARAMGQLEGMLDNPAWMPACVAIAQTSARRDGRVERWVNTVPDLPAEVLGGKDPSKGFVPTDLGRLIAPQGYSALTAVRRHGRYTGTDNPLSRVYTATIDAMIDYGWPVSAWLK